MGLPAGSGSVEKVDFMPRYAAHLADKIRRDTGLSRPFEGLRIIVDAGNGVGGFFVEQVLKPLGADTCGSQYLEPDGMFPHHIPNPEDAEAMAAIRDAVLRNRRIWALSLIPTATARRWWTPPQRDQP